MPVRRIDLSRGRRTSNTHETLKRRLVDEWLSRGSVEPRPDIIEETDARGRIVHVYVVWDDWGSLSQRERSEIIMDACEEALGQDRSLDVTVAMGLTRDEAPQMGLSAV